MSFVISELVRPGLAIQVGGSTGLLVCKLISEGEQYIFCALVIVVVTALVMQISFANVVQKVSGAFLFLFSAYFSVGIVLFLVSVAGWTQ